MLDPRELYTVDAEQFAAAAGRGLTLLHVFDGYLDGGEVVARLGEHLERTCDPREIATFEMDLLHDFRARRPVVTFDVNRWSAPVWPRLALSLCTDAAGRDFLLLRGPEPDRRWNQALEAVLGLVEELGVAQLVTFLGAPLPAPHTRPPAITTHGTSDDLIEPNPMFFDRLDLSGGFSAMLEIRAGERGLPARGFVVHVPHYVAQSAFAPAAVAAAEKLGTFGIAVDLDALRPDAEEALAALDRERQTDSDFAELVEQLEHAYDERARQGAAVPGLDEIGRAVEQLLAEEGER